MFTNDTIVLSDSIPLHLINSLYRHYEKSENQMTIGELYLILKLLLSKLEDELEKMGMSVNFDGAE